MRRFERLDRHYTQDWNNVENYEQAKADNFKGWVCHHRLETHNSDGERRLVELTEKELRALGVYIDRPASDLVFLTRSEHMKLHKPGKYVDDDTRKIIYEKSSKAQKGKPKSKKSAAKSAESRKGQLWYNNGLTETRAFECPEGFVKGRIKRIKDNNSEVKE